jgi:indolepyruvate ferredoxin oxidoreductase beta subunit
VRVADLKTRRSRFARVSQEVSLNDKQLIDIHEFMHPRLEEIADTLPAGVGRWLLASPMARAVVGRFTQKGRVVQTSSLRGFLLLYGVASLRRIRPVSLRYQTEQQRIEAWWAQALQLLPQHADLALEVLRGQQLVKGYGDTHARGWRHFEKLMTTLPRLQQLPAQSSLGRRQWPGAGSGRETTGTCVTPATWHTRLPYKFPNDPQPQKETSP